MAVRSNLIHTPTFSSQLAKVPVVQLVTHVAWMVRLPEPMAVRKRGVPILGNGMVWMGRSLQRRNTEGGGRRGHVEFLKKEEGCRDSWTKIWWYVCVHSFILNQLFRIFRERDSFPTNSRPIFNLWEEDNFSTQDKLAGLNVSFAGRFRCSHIGFEKKVNCWLLL